MRARTWWPVLAVLLLAAGCLTETALQPLPSTPLTPSGASVATAEGVRLLANGDAWRDHPSDLETIVTPVLVHIDNQSGRTLRVDGKQFVLEGSSGFQYAALSPFELREEGLAVGGSGVDGHVALSMGVGLGYGPWGYGFPGWYGSGWYGPGWHGPGWWYGPGLYDPWLVPGWYGPGWYGPYTYWVPPEPLPTQDMVRKALPEGTLNPGGNVTGFLYFQSVGNREGQVTLQARLVDAHTGEQFGAVSIPFGVRSVKRY
uniref:Starvation lipoprotein Slp n=1 Tax=Vitiosangium cumulatum TaxID=1867796 RepID=A0A7D5BV19_9BACT|nr:starvation lipoprotein Slp [Vitiosangium cumulatum]